jgi:tetratricopeptide (TPR) repeat protein
MEIRNLILMLAWLFGFSAMQAQGVEDVGKITLSVVMPENVDGLTASQLSKLESKITQITTKAGLSASGYNQTFVIYPKFAIYESEVVEGGMQNITVVKVELSLYIKQVSNNLLFSSIAKSLKGSGKTKEIAITNAISQIPVTDAAFASFITEGKQKIVKYYESNCDDIAKKADAYIKMKQYDQALGLLMSVPEEITNCYDKILNKSLDAYKAYQNQVCSEKLMQAKTLSAAMDYKEALDILSKIDPSANCFQETSNLIKSIETKITAEDKKQWDFQMKQYNDAVSLEKRRINAIKEIAVSYYKSQPTSVNYNYIIRHY